MRICHVLSCSDVALVGSLPQACLLLALALGLAPSLRGVADNVLNMFVCVDFGLTRLF